MSFHKQYDKNLIFPQQSFIAYIFYVSSAKELNVITRKGRQYRVTISHEIMNQLLRSVNRGSFINLEILHSGKYQVTFVQLVPMATLEQIIMPEAVKFWLNKPQDVMHTELSDVLWEYTRLQEAIALHKKTGATKYYKWILSFTRGYKTLLSNYKKERGLP